MILNKLSKLNSNKYSYIIVAVIIIAVGFYFRLDYFDDGLWSDEWISYYIASSNLDIIQKYNHHLQYEGASPINLFINIFLINIFGNSYQNVEIGYFFISIIGLIVALDFFKTKQKKIFFLFFLSLNPFLIYYSGEVRFYIISLLFSILSTLSFVKLYEDKNIFTTINFFIFTLISILINIHTVVLVIAYLIFNFFKEKKKLIYLLLGTIVLVSIMINFKYIFSIFSLYHLAVGGAGGNINSKFFIGYFFNIFFGDKLFGAVMLFFFLYSLHFLRKEIFNNNKLLLSYIIIFITYFLYITYALLIKDIFFPRHFIFIVPLIIFIISSAIFKIEKIKIKLPIIVLFVFVSFYVNLKEIKPYLLSKPNPNFILNEISKSENKYIYLSNLKEIDFLKSEKMICCHYDQLLFMHSKNFVKSDFIILLNDEFKDYSKFWIVGVNNPSFRDIKNNNYINNIGTEVEDIEHTHIKEKSITRNEFQATLYKKK